MKANKSKAQFSILHAQQHAKNAASMRMRAPNQRQNTRLSTIAATCAYLAFTPAFAEDSAAPHPTPAAVVIDLDKGAVVEVAHPTTTSPATAPSAAPSAPAITDTQTSTPTSAPTSAPAPATTLAEQIKTLLTAPDKTAEKINWPRNGAFTNHINDQITNIYAQREFEPLWLHDAHWTEAARAVRARLVQAQDDALDLRLTPLPDLSDDISTQARADIALSRAAVNYARQANGARIDPRSIAETITAKPNITDVKTILSALPASKTAGDDLEAYNPPQAGYQALRAKLAEVRRAHPKETQRSFNISGPILRTGMSDERVPLIRVRLGLKDDAAAEPTSMLYDAKLASAVADFQRAAGLPATGTLTPRTARALSQNQANDLEGELISNMERWRWMPRNLGQNHIEVNIPDFTVRVIHGTQTVLQERVVVGKPTTPTPLFSNVMQFLIINPYWNVPPSIIKKEMLPKLAEDPNYFQKLGYEVIKTNNRLIVRQPPGERNALGRIKFMFPNDHAVYLHDTPQRSYFASNQRAFSHGCVRVDQPLHLAEIVLGPEQGWSQERVKKMIGGAEKTVHLPEPLPIHIGYFTTFFDESGQLQTRKDIYGYSQKVRDALGLGS